MKKHLPDPINILALSIIFFLPLVSQAQEVIPAAVDSLEFEIAQNAVKVFGDYTVEKGKTLTENLHVVGGDIYIEGIVSENVQIAVYGGDVYIEDTGEVHGQIICLGGKVINRSGREITGGIFEANLGGLTLKRKEAVKEEDEESRAERHKRRLNYKSLVHSPDFYDKDTHVRYNPVEGVYLQFSPDRRIYVFPYIHLILNIGYGFAMDDWRARATLEKYLWKKNPMTFYISGYRATESKDKWIISEGENSAAAFFFHENFMNFYEATGFYLGVTQRFFRTLQYTVQYTSEDQRSLENNTDWSLFYSKHTFPDNDPINDGLMTTMTYSLRFGNHWDREPALSGFSLFLSAEISDTTMNSEFQFRRFLADTRLYIPIGDYLVFRNRFRLGSSEGHLPLQKQFVMGGIGSVRGYPFYSLIHPLGGNRMFLANFELAVFTEASGDNTIFIFFDTGNVWHEDENSDFMKGFADVPDNLLSSTGIGFGEIDDGFRVDFTKRLDRGGRDAWSISVRFQLPF